ncbi:acyltransferase family protein [Pseudoalteromonas sp. S2893]|uniref:acyltransferase family protein n=1 Tax=Pseudoalteromonas sp. S2893 TaxID=579530 RepID=UPI00110B53D5|nr:acyltransferase family protein [Pseudoalteromonas sp. S2893]TMP17324.1 hypothetical protein CWC04_09000 [Pseudoalteromonas sp. S2893]
MNRITWLDTSRGLAIVLLILVHYVGALETRGFISYEAMNLVKAFLRVATPYFIMIFGFTFAVAYKTKINNFRDVLVIQKRLRKNLLLVFIAREIIAVTAVFRYGDYKTDLIDVLLYKNFSQSGEILTFYFFAILLAPLAMLLINKVKSSIFLFSAFSLYIISYTIGYNFSSSESGLLFRFLFFDVYAFFPFFSLAMVSMYLYTLYSSLNNNYQRVKTFLLIGSTLFTISVILLFGLYEDVVVALATAKLKSPPQILYMALYSGEAILLTIFVCALKYNNLLSIINNRLLPLLGRNSLLAYVGHYFLFLAGPIAITVLDERSAIGELIIFLSLVTLLITVITTRDNFKTKGLK